MFDEIVKKGRRSQVKLITEVIQISRFLKYIKRYPDYCWSMFVDSPGEAVNAKNIFYLY